MYLLNRSMLLSLKYVFLSVTKQFFLAWNSPMCALVDVCAYNCASVCTHEKMVQDS